MAYRLPLHCTQTNYNSLTFFCSALSILNIFSHRCVFFCSVRNYSHFSQQRRWYYINVRRMERRERRTRTKEWLQERENKGEEREKHLISRIWVTCLQTSPTRAHHKDVSMYLPLWFFLRVFWDSMKIYFDCFIVMKVIVVAKRSIVKTVETSRFMS